MHGPVKLSRWSSALCQSSITLCVIIARRTYCLYGGAKVGEQLDVLVGRVESASLSTGMTGVLGKHAHALVCVILSMDRVKRDPQLFAFCP